MNNRLKALYTIFYISLILAEPIISVLAILAAANGLQRPYVVIFVTGAAILFGFGLWFWIREDQILKQSVE